ncbi:MAG: hypothetical protein JW941_11530, partial [Candidatus Coatesbacteria bacterium]|nr:hypothetical protein [Candidatus Coatesbacteria bacterium]
VNLQYQPYIYDVCLDKNDVAWFTTYVSGVFSYDGSVWRRYGTSNSAIAFDGPVSKVFVDSLNRKWIPGGYGGISILTEGAPEGGTPPTVPWKPDPANLGVVRHSPVVLTWECEDPDPGEVISYDVWIEIYGRMWKEAEGLKERSFTFFPFYEGAIEWRIDAIDQQGNVTEGPTWLFIFDVTTSRDLEIEALSLSPDPPVVGEPCTLSFDLRYSGMVPIYNLDCALWLEASCGDDPSENVSWWSDGDLRFGTGPMQPNEILSVEREIVILSTVKKASRFNVLLFVDNSDAGMLLDSEVYEFKTVVPNQDEYINSLAEAVASLRGGLSERWASPGHYYRMVWFHNHELLEGVTPTFCASASNMALARWDLEAVGKYEAQHYAVMGNGLLWEGSPVGELLWDSTFVKGQSSLLIAGIEYLRESLTLGRLEALPAQDLREFICSFVRHYNLFTSANLERKGFGATNTILAFFYSEDEGCAPTCFGIDGSKWGNTWMEPEREGTYSLDLMQMPSVGSEKVSTFNNILLQKESIITIKSLSSDLKSPTLCLDRDGDGLFDGIYEPSNVETTPPYPIQSIGWNKPNAGNSGEVKVTFTLANPGPAQDIDIYIACDLGDGQLLFYPDFTSTLSGISLAIPVKFCLERYSLIETELPYGLAIEPVHFYCGISATDEFRLLRPIDFL